MAVGLARRLVRSCVAVVLFACAPAAGAATWSPLTGPTSGVQQVGQVRGPDGTLHVVWARDTPGSGGATQDIVTAPISAGGAIGSPVAIAASFATVSDPAIVNQPGGGLEVFFGAIQCTQSTCPLGLFAATSTDSGATWTPPALISNTDQSYASDMNAAELSDGTPFETWSHTTGVTVHRGVDPASPDYDFQGTLGAGCCGYESNLAADAAGHLQLAWDSNATGHLGVFSQAVDPASGAPSGSALAMPGSVTSYAGTPSHSQMLSRTPVVALPGRSGQFYVAYPGGYPQTSKVLLWHVGSASPVTVADEPFDHNAVSLAADANGRLWVFWTTPRTDGPHVLAERLTATAAEPPVDLGAPPKAATIFALDGAVSPSGDPEALALAGFSDGTAGTYYARGPQIAPLPAPVLGKSFSVAPVAGTVFVKVPGGSGAAGGSGYGGPAADAALTKGKGFVPLTAARSVPAGSVIDARRGTLRLVTAAAKRGKTQSGVFRLGLFKLSQASRGLRKGLATLSLVESAFPGAPTFANCPARAAAAGPHAHAALSSRILQTLRARAHGLFRTKGRFSAGTVRGTNWGTRDRCDGTLTIVRRGTVMVRDFGRRKTIAVHAGHRYLAKAFGRLHK